MAKKTKQNIKKGIVIFVEGETDKFFYEALLIYFKTISESEIIVEKPLIFNLKGVGNYNAKALSKFKKDCVEKYPDVSFTVFCAYDTDIFEYAVKPAVNWSRVEKILKDSGAKKVIHLKAKRNIEDWFMLDSEGICRYLGMKLTTVTGKDGLDKIKKLFKQKNKVYQKGSYTEKFIPYLDLSLLYQQLHTTLEPLKKAYQ
ncbi:hypothetical protein [Azotosporobacter soli]|uniref:hypothetical protein n=1 Tax=Azotosporobacter soli TaxID=3055040 RepID=UPI0031FEDB82